MSYNRKQMRKIAKLSPKELKLFLTGEDLKVASDTVDSYSVAIAMVLFDKLNYDKEALKSIIDEIMYLFDSMEKGYTSIEDCKKTLLEEAGLEFDEKRN